MKLGTSFRWLFVAIALAQSFLMSSTAVAQTSSASDETSAASIILVGLFCCVLPLGVAVAALIFFMRNRKPFQLGTQTTSSVEEINQQSIQTYTMNGWQITTQGTGITTFAKNVSVNPLVAFALFCCWVVPGIIYLVVGGRAISATVSSRKIDSSTTAVQVTGSANGFGGQLTAKRFLSGLPLPAGYTQPAELTEPEDEPAIKI